MKNKKGMIYGVLLMTCLVIGLSYKQVINSTPYIIPFLFFIYFIPP